MNALPWAFTPLTMVERPNVPIGDGVRVATTFAGPRVHASGRSWFWGIVTLRWLSAEGIP